MIDFKTIRGGNPRLTLEYIEKYNHRTQARNARDLGLTEANYRYHIGKLKEGARRVCSHLAEDLPKLRKKLTVDCMHGCGRPVTKTVSVDSNRGMRFSCPSCKGSDAFDGYTGYRVAC